MFKKRFSKWGFQKNSKRSAAAVLTSAAESECKKAANRWLSGPRAPVLLVISPGLGPHDALMSNFMTNVHTFSTAFFESVQAPNGLSLMLQQQSTLDQPRPEDTEEISFAFKLVIELLDRGHGNLAGRMARKAFVLVEDILTLDGPVIVWNLIDLLHQMVQLGHVQLFQMLLTHLIELVDGRKPETHPLTGMLHSLQGLVIGLSSLVSTFSSSAPTSSNSTLLLSPSTGNETDTTVAGVRLFSRAVSSLLERAWILNAEILFDHFDHRLFQVYFHVHWDLCSIRPPAAIFGALKQWLSHVEQQQISSTAVGAPGTEDIFGFTSVQQLLPPYKATSPPQDYEALSTSSMAALWEHGVSILSGSPGSVDTNVLLRILAGLFTADTLERWSIAVTQLGLASSAMMQISRVHASNVACAIKTLTDLNSEYVGDERWQSLNGVEQIRSVVALREYAHGKTCPRVVRDMWQLQDALVAVGEHEEAQEIGQSVSRRIEEYMQDISACSA